MLKRTPARRNPHRLSLLLQDRSPTLLLSSGHLGAGFSGHLPPLPRFSSCPWATPISSFGFGQDGTRLFENGNLSVNRGENLVSFHPAIVTAPNVSVRAVARAWRWTATPPFSHEWLTNAVLRGQCPLWIVFTFNPPVLAPCLLKRVTKSCVGIRMPRTGSAHC